MGKPKWIMCLTALLIVAICASCASKTDNQAVQTDAKATVSVEAPSEAPLETPAETPQASAQAADGATAAPNADAQTTPLPIADDSSKRAWMTAIVEGVYETPVKSFSDPVAEPITLLGESVIVYQVECEDGSVCQITTIADGSPFLNENIEAPNFRKVTITEDQTVMGACVNGSHSGDEYEAKALDLLKMLELGNDLEISADEDAVLDHREVKVFAVHKKDKEDKPVAFIAIDDGLEACYLKEGKNGDYLALTVEGDGLKKGDPVTVGKPLPKA